MILKDIRYGIRSLVRNPAFTAIAIITLALGIGANSAIFSVVNTVLLRPLPFVDPDRLVQIQEFDKKNNFEAAVPPILFFQLREEAKSYAEIAALKFATFHLSGGEFPELIKGFQVSANLFSMLGVRPLLGR